MECISFTVDPEDVVILNTEDGSSLEWDMGHILIVSSRTNTFTSSSVIFLDSSVIPKGKVGLASKMMNHLRCKPGDSVRVSIGTRVPPESYAFIKKRMSGTPFTNEEITSIVTDISSGRLSALEQSAFILTQMFQDLEMEEIEQFTRAIAVSGDMLDFDEPAYDKHSLGGVPGNKVSLLIVPIIAAAGLLIPKTSSRAITSPSGTADTFSVLAEVNFSIDEITEIAPRTRGMITWGGALNLAPADDKLIREVEYPLGVNPFSMMITSIMAKKIAIGVDFLALDIPTGKGTKVADQKTASHIGHRFAELAHRLDIKIECGVTYGNHPVGHAIGPALEAREALAALETPKNASSSLVEKSTALAGILFELAGIIPRGAGQDYAKEFLYNGKALNKMLEIIEAQGGDPSVKPADIPLGQHVFEVQAPADGWIVEIDNKAISRIARAAGAPKDHGAGIFLIKKKESIKAGEPIMRIYAETERQLNEAQGLYAKLSPITVEGMLLGRI